MRRIFSFVGVVSFTLICLPAAPAQRKPSVANVSPSLVSKPAPPDPIREADRLFAHGEDFARDRQALETLERALATDSNNYQLLWRAARSYYYVGDSAPKSDKLGYFNKGVAVAQRAVAQQPNAVEGHFWLGANYGGQSELRGAFNALATVKKIRAEMETVVRLNPAYCDANAYLALGEIDRELPRLLGGNVKRAISSLEQGLRIAPKNLDIKLALAKAYREDGRKDDARRQLQEILQLPINPAEAKANREVQAQARELLNK